MSVIAEFRRTIDLFRQPERWLTYRKGLVLACGVSVSVSVVASWIRNNTSTSKLPLLGVLAGFVGLFLAVGVMWWLWREYRLRCGADGKVAVAYEGYALKRDDWDYTRARIQDHFEQKRLRSHVTLCLIPFELVRNDARRNRFMRKYSFSCLIRIIVSGKAPSSETDHWRYEIYGTHKGKLSREFLKATGKHMTALAVTPPSNVTTQILEFRASSIYQITLLAIAVYYASAGRNFDAAEVLSVLDDALKKRCGHDKQPRVAIRWFGAMAESACARVAMAQIPVPQQIESMVDRSSLAIERYGNQFPFIYVNHARAAFMKGDLDGACDAIAQAEQLHLDDATAAQVVLGSAALSLFRSEFHRSAERFFGLFQHENVSCMDWNDLSLFADYCAECGYEGAVFLQGAYRKMAGKTVSEQIESSLLEWIRADGSRTAFGTLYRKTVPAAYAQMRKKIPGKSRKQAKREKRKGRKTRKRPRRR